MYYLGWLITSEKMNRKIQFVARRSTYPLIYEMNLDKMYKRIEYAENQIQRIEESNYVDFEKV